MPNIPGSIGYQQPDTFSRVRTIRKSVSIPGGLRIACIMGLGEHEEIVVASANGAGDDGSNPDFSASNTPDGRHFQLANTNLVANRSTVYINGIPLTGIEETITVAAFDNKYDYRLEPVTGRIELQRAHLIDQGGEYYVAASTNVGNGTLTTLELLDASAPAETWTLRVTSVIRDAYGDPISGNATFNVIGSVSGTLLDAYGAPVTFMSDAVIRDNGILRIAITEGATAFDRGDRFTVKVGSNVLAEGDELKVRGIATINLNDPEFFLDPNSLYAKHGTPSTSNTLSLGAQMAFENGAFGILAIQCKPTVPRRTSNVLVKVDNPLTATQEGMPSVITGSSPTHDDIDIFKFTIDDGGVPDSDTSVNIFVTDATSQEETQIFPTKVPFYNTTITADPYNEFIDIENADYTFSYTVILDGEVEDEGVDGVVNVGQSKFQADSASFAAHNIDVGEIDTTKYIRISRKNAFDVDVAGVAGTYTISAVGDGTGDDTIVTLGGVVAGSHGTLPFVASKTDLRWELIDPADESAKLLITKDLNTGNAIGEGDGLRITYVDIDDAAFYDSNWGTALEALEVEDLQLLVPLPDQNYSSIFQACRVHVDLMSTTANKKERMLLIGAVQGITAEALIGTELVAVEDIAVLEGIQGDSADEILNGDIEDLQDYSVASAFGETFRVVYLFPDQIVRTISGTRTYLHGLYLAAAAAGRLSGTANAAMPLTNKVLTGFSILRDRVYKQYTLNQLGEAGVTVVVPVTGGGKVLHGKTTVSSGAAEEEEISIIAVRDQIATSMRAVLRSFIGQPEDATLAAAIMSKCVSALNAFIAQGYISTYQSLNVTRDGTDPRQWNVVVEILPTYPVNWIFIDVSVGIS